MDKQPRYPYVHVECVDSHAELLSLRLWELGALGVEERDDTTIEQAKCKGCVLLVASFADENAAQHAVDAIGLDAESRLEFVVGDAWKHEWRSYFKPTRIGERLLLCPSWDLEEPKAHEVRLIIDPGGAFGSGTHETTRLVLAELDSRVKGDEVLLDVGCGSGILSIAALKLGATRAVAIDIEEAARDASVENAEINGVADALDVSTNALHTIKDPFPLVVANIRSEILIPMANELIKRVAGNGVLVLCGILYTEAEDVKTAYASMKHVGESREGEWVALTFAQSAYE